MVVDVVVDVAVAERKKRESVEFVVSISPTWKAVIASRSPLIITKQENSGATFQRQEGATARKNGLIWIYIFF